MILKLIIAVLIILLFAQAWITVEALNNEREGSVFALYKSEKDGVKSKTIYSTIILIVGCVLLFSGVFMGGKAAYKHKNMLK